MIDIKEKFKQVNGINSFQRVDNEHNLDLYLGLDTMSRYTLFLVSENEVKHLFSSHLINVQVGQRVDGRWGISFSLVNNDFEDLYFHFCTDIVESSRTVRKKEKGAEFICSRFIKWQNMLSKFSNGILSQTEIKGLIGELLFLKDFMIPLYGEEAAINSWIGPEKADQDFVCENMW